MKRAASLLLLLALVASSFPVSLLAQEAASTTPESVASSTPPSPEPAPETSSSTEPIIPSAPETSSIPEPEGDASSPFAATFAAPAALVPGEHYVFTQNDATSDIVFEGAAGGSVHVLEPRPVHTALHTGTPKTLRMYLARNGADGGLFGRSIFLTIYFAGTGQQACTLWAAGESFAPGVARDNYDRIPVGGASDMELIEFDTTTSDCFFIKGVSYTFELNNRVPGDPRWTNGILYTKGADSTSNFFLEVITDEVPPPPPPETRPGERLLIDQSDASEDILFEGAAGGRYTLLEPAATYTAIDSGTVSRVRLQIARNRVYENDPRFFSDLWVDLMDVDTGARVCNLFQAGAFAPGSARTNYYLIPIGGPLDTALVEFTDPMGDCVVEGGRSYKAQLVHKVDGDPRDINGTLYLKGADSTSKFFLQVLADDDTAVSSILFLPGIQGSRLYEASGSGENRRWELDFGNSQQDAKRLYLNPDGTSINAIYTKAGDAVDRVNIPFVGFDVYRTFFEKLEEWKGDGSIADYLIFPYDWRQNPIDVVEQGTLYEDGLHFLDADTLAFASSTNSKITIIAHSNGGLVAKALLRKLEQSGKADIIDRVIFVDVPQLGTPEALLGLLHGDLGMLTGFGGVYLNKSNARGLAEYMPDAYALLPSAEYFNRIADPIIDLSKAPNLKNSQGFTTNLINTIADLNKFLTGAGGRLKPGPGDVERPNNLSPTLLAEAQSTHDVLDSWMPPANVQVVQIAGWGLDTSKGVEYIEKPKTICPLTGTNCIQTVELTHRATTTEDGDFTVVSPSQTANPNEKYFVNLRSINDANKTNYNHANITEVQEFQSLVSLLLNADTAADLPTYISTEKPNNTELSRKIQLRGLSPIKIDAYDSQGRHTGLVPNPNESDLIFKEEQISNSYYREFGEGKYLGLPVDDSIDIEIQGTDTGTFTFEITATGGGERSETLVYKDVPVSASTTASLSVEGDDLSNVELALDMNGDGSTDIVLDTTAASETPLTYVRLMKANIPSMMMGATTTQQLLAKLSNVEHLILKDSKWNDIDDDNDRNDVKKNEKIEKRILRKLDKIEAWINKQILKSEKQEKKGKNPDRINRTQAAVLIDMIQYLRTLIK